MFGLCQIVAFANYLGSKLTGEEFEILYKGLLGGSLVLILGLGSVLALSGEFEIDVFFFGGIHARITSKNLPAICCFQVKLLLGREDFIHFWIPLTPKITFRSLLLYRNTSRRRGLRFISICRV